MRNLGSTMRRLTPSWYDLCYKGEWTKNDHALILAPPHHLVLYLTSYSFGPHYLELIEVPPKAIHAELHGDSLQMQ